MWVGFEHVYLEGGINIPLQSRPAIACTSYKSQLDAGNWRKFGAGQLTKVSESHCGTKQNCSCVDFVVVSTMMMIVIVMLVADVAGEIDY